MTTTDVTPYGDILFHGTDNHITAFVHLDSFNPRPDEHCAKCDQPGTTATVLTPPAERQHYHVGCIPWSAVPGRPDTRNPLKDTDNA